MGRNRKDDSMFASMIDGADDMVDDILESEEDLSAMNPDAVDLDYISKIGKQSKRIEENLKPLANKKYRPSQANASQHADQSGLAKQVISEWVINNPKVVKSALSECVKALSEPYMEQLIEQEVERRVNVLIEEKIKHNNKAIVAMIKKYIRR